MAMSGAKIERLKTRTALYKTHHSSMIFTSQQTTRSKDPIHSNFRSKTSLSRASVCFLFFAAAAAGTWQLITEVGWLLSPLHRRRRRRLLASFFGFSVAASAGGAQLIVGHTPWRLCSRKKIRKEIDFGLFRVSEWVCRKPSALQRISKN